jgi:hypothetical protein
VIFDHPIAQTKGNKEQSKNGKLTVFFFELPELILGGR